MRTFLLLSVGVMGCTNVEPASANRAALVPTDPLYARQRWHHELIKLPQAWDLTLGNPNTVIGVIDTGRENHPELNASWFDGYGALCREPDPVAAGDFHHGAHVAGLLAAPLNGVGGVGVCPRCRLMPINIVSTPSSMTPLCAGEALYTRVEMLADAITYAAGGAVFLQNNTNQAPAAPANVINISAGNQLPVAQCPPLVRSALQFANDAGIAVVVSAGNVNSENVRDDRFEHFFWYGCTDAIVVTSVKPDGGLEPYAARGPGVTLAAPGGEAGPPSADGGRRGDGFGELVDCPDAGDPTNRVTQGVFSSWITSTGAACSRGWSGTSMSAPLVSGTVALMLSRQPGLTPWQVREVLTRTATPLACTQTNECGAGLLNTFAAVQAATTAPLIKATPTTLLGFEGTRTTGTVELRSAGMGLVNISRLTLEGGSFEFDSKSCPGGVTCQQPVSLPLTGTFGVQVRCVPTAASQTGRLVIASNVPGPAVTVTLSCTSAGPPPPSIQVSPTDVDGGVIALGVTATQVLTVSNVGSGQLTFSTRNLNRAEATLACTSGCTCNDEVCSGALAASASAVLELSLSPDIGNQSGTVSFTSNDTLRPTVTVRWSATGLGGRLVMVPAADLPFGEVAVGELKPLDVTLTNVGNAAVEGIELTAIGDSVFKTLRPPKRELVGGESTTFTLGCVPEREDNFGASYRLHSSDRPWPRYWFQLFTSCTGVPSGIELSVPPLQPGGPDAMTIRNTSSAPRTLTSLATSGPPFSLHPNLPVAEFRWVPPLSLGPGEEHLLKVWCTNRGEQVNTPQTGLLTLSGGVPGVPLAIAPITCGAK